MRHALVSPVILILTLLLGTLPALAFEIEDQHSFGPPEATNRLSILSTTDIAFFAPLAEAFLARNPDLAVHYVQASSQSVQQAIGTEEAAFDLVISTAMDLQMKLANDGFAQGLPADVVQSLPSWARWRDRLVSIALEPVVLLLADAAIPEGREPPRSRRDLIALMRDHPDLFEGRIGTYDPRTSGAGYLFLTQDARTSDTIWRLAEVMGRLNARLYCCSSQMIEGLISGDLVMAYNVLGSYASANLPPDAAVHVVTLQDFTVTLQRTALVPANAPRGDLGASFLRFLLSDRGQQIQADAVGQGVMRPESFVNQPWLRPIRLDPGLLSTLDSMTRRRFLSEWAAAMEQP
ncbi:ABC transporter substrate-binding protein [Pararhodobacter sp. CCB-MM2]|uniref:ABC transporter substrate-binding protein n=1 Tax=Pararhodobacter sp. CCB-MM2 TaxID=1786003 RepID=UPI0008326C6D|nr:ABC transporter substrate-binding protein [Pararhodobacter sp. CCB-MM2]